jgi:predicted helicase
MIPAFHELGEDLFEDLCREFLQEEPDVETAERYGTRKGQRQLGIDLLIEFKDKSLAAGQCKSHQRCDAALIRTAGEDFLHHAEHWRQEVSGRSSCSLQRIRDARSYTNGSANV